MSVFRPDSRALITGGASGIGLAVAPHCLAASMRVTIVDNNQATLVLASKTLKGEVSCVKADVSDAAAWKELRESVGEVDFLMLNAGRMVRGSWGEEEYFRQVSFSYIQKKLKNYTAIDGEDCVGPRYEFVRRDQRAERLRALFPEKIRGAACHRRHGQQARHHQPAGQRGLQRVQSGRQGAGGASLLRP